MTVRMTLPQAEELLKQFPEPPDYGKSGKDFCEKWWHAKNMVDDHRKQIRAQCPAVKEQVEEQVEEQVADSDQVDWEKLPFYMKWWYIAIDWFQTSLFGKIERWHIIALIVILVLVFFGGRGISSFLKRIAIANADPPATEAPIANLSLLIQQQQESIVPTAQPSILLLQPMQDSSSRYVINDPSSDHAATVRDCTKDGYPKLDLPMIPNGTSVTVVQFLSTPNTCEKNAAGNEICERAIITDVPGYPAGVCIHASVIK